MWVEIVHKIMVEEGDRGIEFDNRDRLPWKFNETIFNAINGLVGTTIGLIVGRKV